MTEKFSQWFMDRVAAMSLFFTEQRPRPFVRRMQAILLGTTVIIMTVALSYPNLAQPRVDLGPDSEWAPGQTSERDFIAVVSLEYLSEEALEEARQKAANDAPPHFVRDFGILGDHPTQLSLAKLLAEDATKIQTCRGRATVAARNACIRAIGRQWQITDEQINALLALPARMREQRVRQIANELFSRFLILEAPPDHESFERSEADSIVVHNVGGSQPRDEETLGRDQIVMRDRLLYNPAYSALAEIVSRVEPNQTRARALRTQVARYLRQLNGTRYDVERTTEAQQNAYQDLNPSELTIRYSRGDVIVKSGDVISDELYAILRKHNETHLWEAAARIFSIFVQQAILTALMLYFAVRFAPKRIDDLASNLIIFLTIWMFAAVLVLTERIWATDAQTNEVAHFFGAWVPVSIFVVLLAIVFGEKLTIPLGMYLSFLVFIASKYDGVSLLISTTLSMSAAIMGARITKRVHFISTSVALALLSFTLVTAGYLYTGRSILDSTPDSPDWLSDAYWDAALYGMGAGMATLFVMIVLPAYEALFNIPTRFRLAELADPSHPLLQEMFRKAPSTWTHTLMVAAMTEKACERLGLNTMLARTGIYFHDIGKMKNAGFFIENQHLVPKPENIDRDNPARAARVIIDHVLDGITLAEHYRLPREVIAFIPEHHGTSTMAFFYHKALEKMKRRVRREDFRYPGPRPQSRETGIAMIADSVEAASRSLDEVSEESLNALIQKITNIKLAEHQLDESGLTVGDLSAIREAFKDVLISSYHSRPKYPNQEDTKKLEDTQKNGRSKSRTRSTKKATAKKKKKASRT